MSCLSNLLDGLRTEAGVTEGAGSMWRAGYQRAKEDIKRHGEAYAVRVPDPHDNDEWVAGYINALSNKNHAKALKRLLTMIPGVASTDSGSRAKWYDER